MEPAPPSGPLTGILLLASGALALVAAMRLDASQAAATERAPGQPERGDSPLLPISFRSRFLVAVASAVAAAVAFAALDDNRTGEIALTTEMLSVLARNVWNALLMFNWDSGPHSLAFRPIPDGVTAAAFVLGIGYLLWRAVKLRDRRALYVLLSFGVMLLPSILALAFPEENPSPARTGGALPLVMLISALPLTLLSSRLSRLPRAIARLGRWPAVAAFTALYVTIAVLNYRWYFVDFDSYLRKGGWNTREMGQRLHRFVEDGGTLVSSD